MENAVQFDRKSNTIRVKHLLNAGGIDGIELRTVLEALDVSQKQYFLLPHLNWMEHWSTLLSFFCD